MVPESYKIALGALVAVWKQNQSESLTILLGGMSINPNDESPMDPGCLYDWEQIAAKAENTKPFDLMMAFLDLDASRYRTVPQDLTHLIDALRTKGSPERGLVESVIATWPTGYDQSALYSWLIKER